MAKTKGYTIEEMWKSFQTEVYPTVDEKSSRYQLLRECFFSGAYAFLGEMVAVASFNDDIGAQWLISRKNEIEENAKAFMKNHTDRCDQCGRLLEISDGPRPCLQCAGMDSEKK
jgi:hypothetical protein